MTVLSKIAYNRRVSRPKIKPVRFQSRFTPEVGDLIEQLIEALNTDKTGAVERGVYCIAERYNIKPRPERVAEIRAAYSHTDPPTEK